MYLYETRLCRSNPVQAGLLKVCWKDETIEKEMKMIVIGTIIFPETSANEVAECYKKLPAMPDFITIDGTYVYNNTGEQIRAFSIFNFDDAHLEEANTYFKSRYKSFETVEGLTSDYKEWLKVQDALSLVDSGDFDIDLKIF